MPGVIRQFKPHTWGAWRDIFVSGEAVSDKLVRTMGEYYSPVLPHNPVVTIDGSRGTLWLGRDPTDRGSATDRDVLLRLAKAGFAARETSEEEFRQAVNPGASPPSVEEHTP
ncbi:MAG: hypothetical protein ABR950_04185 [Candidatus Dormibacteria bacterium]|jgi:hypothetical protein